MRIVHVNDADLVGRRFNGYDLLSALEPRGIRSAQIVLTKRSDDPRVVGLRDRPGDNELHLGVTEVERSRGMSNLLYPWGRVLSQTDEFKSADVVHYHLIHNQMISLIDLPVLFKLKPSVWTLHDPWPLTGHCIHPMQCTGWLEGCTDCPHPDRAFPLPGDGARRMWRVKQHVFSRVDVDVVVASRFMEDMVRRSPLTRGSVRVHRIPFGVDPTPFLPEAEKRASRQAFGIPGDDFVLLFRATDVEYKGLPYAVEALALGPPVRPTTLLVLDHRGAVESLRSQYAVVETGWIDDAALYARALSACDVVLMPSTAETFGLMAAEAMAAGRPTVCFEDTALASVAGAPECGIAVPFGNVQALREAVDTLATTPEELARRAATCRTMAAEEYDYDRYLDSLESLYRSVLERSRLDG